LKKKPLLAKTSVAIARLGIAENDAFIACWKGKYDHVLLRPVTYINRHIDPCMENITRYTSISGIYIRSFL
jgi:hypothetical protein